MAKAILIRNMPENCFQCELWHTTDEDDDLCGENFKTVNPIADERPDWCPWIPEPEPIKKYSVARIIGEAQEKHVDPPFAFGYIEGWNACLDALEGKQ